MSALEPRHVHPQRWHQAVDVSREACARLFGDGRTAEDAMRAFGLDTRGATSWARAVNRIAERYCAGHMLSALS